VVASHDRVASYVFVHAHNLLAIALWWSWRAKRSPAQRWTLVLFALATIAIFAGGSDALLAFATSKLSFSPVSSKALTRVVAGLAPVSSDSLALHLVLFFAFSQGVHYATWLRLVPEDDRRRAGIRSFASSARALVADMGLPVLLVALAVATGIAAWAVFDLPRATNGYFRVASFHGYLEIAVALRCLVEWKRPSEP